MNINKLIDESPAPGGDDTELVDRSEGTFGEEILEFAQRNQGQPVYFHFPNDGDTLFMITTKPLSDEEARQEYLSIIGDNEDEW